MAYLRVRSLFPGFSFLLAVLISGIPASAKAQVPALDRPADAAPEGSGASTGIGPESPLVLLMAPTVQKELKLSEDQKSKVYNLGREASQKSRTMMQQAMVRGGGDPRSLLESAQQLRRENDFAIGNLLEKKQSARFEQIVLQSEGPLALGRQEIATRLKLTQNQNQAMQNVMARFQQSRFQTVVLARRAAMTGGGAGAQNVEQATIQLRKEAVQEIGKVVTRTQKDAFNEMLGDPFDIVKGTIERGASSPSTDKPAGDTTDTGKQNGSREEADPQIKTTKKAARLKGKKS